MPKAVQVQLSFIPFLFQTGSIRSNWRTDEFSSKGRFLFQTGSIRRPTIIEEVSAEDDVSIPNWFD